MFVFTVQSINATDSPFLLPLLLFIVAQRDSHSSEEYDAGKKT